MSTLPIVTANAIAASLKVLAERNHLWQDDERDKREDGFRLHYAVDPDVISMYLQPDDNYAPAQLFFSKDTDNNEQLSGHALDKTVARWLSDFLFLEPSSDADPAPRQAYILIPPHHEELMRIVMAIARTAKSAAEQLPDLIRRVRDALQPIFDQYRQNPDDPASQKEFAEKLANHAPDVARLVAIIDGTAVAIQRFSKLHPEKLTHLYNYQETENGPYLMDMTEFELDVAIEQTKVDWYKFLIEHKPRRANFSVVRATEADAKVLATIEYLNRSLYDKKEKLLLITGSPYLYAALEKRKPEKTDPWFKKDHNLASIFLRHPQWIMSHREFFTLSTTSGATRSNESEQQELNLNVNSWLGILSAGRDAQHAAVKSNKMDREELLSLPSKWDQVVRFFATRKYGRDVDESRRDFLQTPAIGEGMSLLKGLLESGEWEQPRLERLLKPRATRMLSALYNDSTMLGLLEQRVRDSKPRRIMPALLFDSKYEVFNEYYVDVQNLLGKGRDDTQQKDIRVLQALQNEMDQPGRDDTYYHRHIIHAAAYGAVELWEPALTLCTLAIGIADHELEAHGWDDSNNAIRGREAAYLAAIATRRKAKDIDALDEARTFLKEAGKRETPGQPVDLRFISEELAIKSRTVYFLYFQTRSQKEEQSARKVIDEIERLLPRAEFLLAQVAMKPERVPELRVAQWILVQCYTNLFTLVLIRVDVFSEQMVSPPQRDMIAKFASVIRTVDLQDPYPIVVCDLMKIVARNASRDEHEELCASVISRLETADKNTRSANFMPYEMQRRIIFRELVDRYR